MESRDLAAEWVPDAEAPDCGLCRVQFGLLTRRHHCRACGGVFCHDCCSRRLRLPHVGLQTLERVCLPCHQRHNLEEVWEAEGFSARYYLRQLPGYTLAAPLFDSCRRTAPEKSLFLVADSRGLEYVLSLLARGPRCQVPYLSSDSARGAFQRVMCGLRHPYLWPCLEASFLDDRDRAAVLCPFAPRGSIRDLLHQANPKDIYGSKYKRKAGTPLPLADICLFGRQILEALLYLTARRLQVTHLHCGNVLVDRRCCYLTGVVENQLLGLVPAVDCTLAAEQEGEVLAFGRLLHEMVLGVPMWANQIPRLPGGRICPQPFAAILRAIFSPPPGARLPTLQELVLLPPFGGVQLVADVRFIRQSPLDPKCLRLLDQVRVAQLQAELPAQGVAGGESFSKWGVGGTQSNASWHAGIEAPESGRGALPVAGTEGKRKNRRRKSAHSATHSRATAGAWDNMPPPPPLARGHNFQDPPGSPPSSPSSPASSPIGNRPRGGVEEADRRSSGNPSAVASGGLDSDHAQRSSSHMDMHVENPPAGNRSRLPAGGLGGSFQETQGAVLMQGRSNNQIEDRNGQAALLAAIRDPSKSRLRHVVQS